MRECKKAANDFRAKDDAENAMLADEAATRISMRTYVAIRPCFTKYDIAYWDASGLMRNIREEPEVASGPGGIVKTIVTLDGLTRVAEEGEELGEGDAIFAVFYMGTLEAFVNTPGAKPYMQDACMY